MAMQNRGLTMPQPSSLLGFVLKISTPRLTLYEVGSTGSPPAMSQEAL